MCATELEVVQGNMRKCPSCAFFHFPKVGACAVGIVHDDVGRILLDKRAYNPGQGLWALLGGYLEPNETPEKALVREVAEESGLLIDVEELVEIGVGGPTCGLFYSARVIGGTLRKSAESTALTWFSPAAIPWNEMAFPRHKEVLFSWLNGRTTEAR